MRFLIFAFLAVAVSATNYGYGSNYYSSYPSYSSYSSYPSSYYGGYGSSLYGATYGSGLGYGSGYGSGYGLGYGSGLTYGSGSYGTGWTGGYATAYKPAVYQTARHSYQQPQATWAQHRSDYAYTGTPGKIEFVLGGAGYRTGTEDYRTPVRTKTVGAFTRGSTSVLGAGAIDGGTGKISFTRDFSTASGQSGIQKSRGVSVFRKTASPVAVVTQKAPTRSFDGTGSVHRSGSHGTSGHQPVIFTQDFSKVTGQSAGRTEIHGINAAHAPVVPHRIPSRPVASIHKSEVHGITADRPHISFTQDFSKVSGHSQQLGRKPQVHSFQKPSFPVIETQHETSGQLNTESHADSDFGQHGGIGFTKTVGEVLTTLPKPAVVSSSPKFATGGVPRIPSGPVGSIRKSEVHGVTADQPHISFIQDFSKVSGHSQQLGRKPQVLSFQKTSVPVIETQQEISDQHNTGRHSVSDFSQQGGISFTQNVGGVHTTLPKPAVVSSSPKFATGGVPRPSSGYVHRTSAVHKSGSHGISSSGEGPRISFVQGTSALRQSDVKTSSYEKILSPAVFSRPTSGARGTGIQSNIPAQGFSTITGPSRITFTQDFSRVTGQRNSAVKPVISIDNKLTAPVIPRVVASREFQAVRRNTPFTSLVDLNKAQKAPQQTVAEELSFTSIQDQPSAHGLFPIRTDADKSIFSAGQVAGIDEGLKTSSFIVAPEAGIAHDKSSAFKHSTVGAVTGGKVSGAHYSTAGHGQLVVPSYGVTTAGDVGDKSKIFVAVPADDFGSDKSSVLLHATGVAPTASFVEEKGSILTINSGEVDPGVSRQGYSSSYPGYSNLFGESPRFDFSPDRSLLYSYGSPHLVSPFSYSYTTGNKYYDQSGRKTVA